MKGQRFYAVSHERRFVWAEALEESLLEEFLPKSIFSRPDMLADPELAKLLAAWERRDDSEYHEWEIVADAAVSIPLRPIPLRIVR